MAARCWQQRQCGGGSGSAVAAVAAAQQGQCGNGKDDNIDGRNGNISPRNKTNKNVVGGGVTNSLCPQ